MRACAVCLFIPGLSYEGLTSVYVGMQALDSDGDGLVTMGDISSLLSENKVPCRGVELMTILEEARQAGAGGWPNGACKSRSQRSLLLQSGLGGTNKNQIGRAHV